jgi:phosphopantothenoylcysteine decarboxylase/phosphopantothenate--cysteine ligase
MRILITAGPTREYFDSVRFISNPSSGRMGYAIAAVAARRKHEVILVSGPVALPDPKGVEVVSVGTAQAMFDVCVARFPGCEAAIMTAAVCDYRPARRLERKLQKRNRPRSIQLLPTPDICRALGRAKGDRVVIGFAMEDHDHRARAEAKLRRKRCDAMVLNGPANVGGDRATVEILCADRGWSGPFTASKKVIAGRIVALATELARDR